jgi:hypothetical protein
MTMVTFGHSSPHYSARLILRTPSPRLRYVCPYSYKNDLNANPKMVPLPIGEAANLPRTFPETAARLF